VRASSISIILESQAISAADNDFRALEALARRETRVSMTMTGSR
jgi:hypothetical protein